MSTGAEEVGVLVTVKDGALLEDTELGEAVVEGVEGTALGGLLGEADGTAVGFTVGYGEGACDGGTVGAPVGLTD